MSSSSRWPPRQILAIDVGNSRIKMGRFLVTGPLPVGWPGDRPTAGESTICEPERSAAVAVTHDIAGASAITSDGPFVAERVLEVQRQVHERLECVDVLGITHGEPIPWEQVCDWCGTSESSRDAHRDGTTTADGRVLAVIAGVNPTHLRRFAGRWRDQLTIPLHEFSKNQTLPIACHVDQPERVGVDRLLAGIAVNARRDPTRPAIVVDTGTAVTVDVLDRRGSFLGGAILPGVDLSAQALQRYTALLPLVLPREVLDEGRPPRAIGKNTRDAIRSGLFHAHVGAVRELVAQQTAALRADAAASPTSTSPLAPELYLTGGAAELLGDSFPEATRATNLPLWGLALACLTARV